MNVFENLSLSEQARQLRNPEGNVGIAVAAFLNDNNRHGYARVFEQLGIADGHRVLEIGFGNGRSCASVIAQASNVTYFGIDISSTMVNEANCFNADRVAAGQASFQLSDSAVIPFPEDSFDRIFSIGVIHFWADPVTDFAEIRRVMRPKAVMYMGCLSPRTPKAFATAENGFHIRSVSEWEAICLAAGFTNSNVQELETDLMMPDGKPVKVYSMDIEAQV